MKKISNYFRFTLLIALGSIIYGCVQYDNFTITEKPYVEKTSVELYIGEDAGDHNQIQLKSSPQGKQYTWTSLDPSVATVTQAGLITAVKEGFAVISVSSDNDEININVWVRNWIPFEDFTLDKQQVEIKRLGKVQIIANPIPQNSSKVDIQWTSSNPEIASVFENGWIVGNEIGSAIITARAAGKEQQIEVQVIQELIKYPRAKWTLPGYTTTHNGPTIGYSSHQTSYPLLNLFDGSATTFWHSAYSGSYISNYPHWFIVDMHRSIDIVEIMLQRRQGFASANGFYLYTCPDVMVNQDDPVDGYPWEDHGEYIFNPDIDAEQRYVVPDSPEARYIKVYFDTQHKSSKAANNYLQLAEFAVYGY